MTESGGEKKKRPIRKPVDQKRRIQESRDDRAKPTDGGRNPAPKAQPKKKPKGG